MVAAPEPVRIEGLKEFRAALKEVSASAPRELTKGIKRAGEPLVSATSRVVPRRSGRLAAGYTVRVRGTTGSIVSKVPYAAGAEWGRRGKWEGFDRYGSTPRFAGAMLEDNATEIQRLITEELNELITLNGWAT